MGLVPCTQHVVEGVLDLLRAHRLEEDLAELRRVGGSGEISCGEHHAKVRLQLLRMERQLDTVEVRHHDVGEKHINVLADENAHRFRRAAGHEHAEPRAAQDFRNRSADELVIIDEKDGKCLGHRAFSNAVPKGPFPEVFIEHRELLAPDRTW